MKAIMMVLSLAVAGNLLAQNPVGTISGTVINREEQPLKAAKVSVFAGEQIIASAITDIKGRFTAANLDTGIYEVKIGYRGHKSSVVTKVPVQDGKNSDMLVKVFEQSDPRDTSSVFSSYNIVAVAPRPEKKIQVKKK